MSTAEGNRGDGAGRATMFQSDYLNKNGGHWTDQYKSGGDPSTGVDARNGQKHMDGSGRWIYDKKSTTWIGQYGNKDGTKSKDLANTIELDNVNVKGYKSNYVPSGIYGPYRPDGSGLTISGSIDFNYTTHSMAFSLVANEKGNLGGFLTFGSGLSSSQFGAGLGISLDFIDTYGGASVFEGLKDYGKGGGGSIGYFGYSHYQSVNERNGQFLNSLQGVNTNSLFFNFKPSTGGNYGVTNTYKLF